MPIKVYIVEDESIVSRDIQMSLTRLGYDVIGHTDSGGKAIQYFSENPPPDIILMDIKIKGKLTGIDTAKIITEKWNIPIIYLTAYADDMTINMAKTTKPYGYILKPFKEIDFKTTIEIALYKHQQEKEIIQERDYLYTLAENKKTQDQDFIFIKVDSKLQKIKKNGIYYIEALKDYVTINLLDKRYTIHSSMKGIDEKLNDGNFVRVHRSYIVRLDKISSIKYPYLELEDGKKLIPIGGSYREQLNDKLNFI